MITSGTVAALHYNESSITVQVMDEKGDDCLIELAATNYKIRGGDFLSWNKKQIFWIPAADSEREVQLFHYTKPVPA